MRHILIKKALVFLIIALIQLSLVNPVSASEGTLSIYTVNYPLKYFAERIGGPYVKVTLPTPPGQDPVYWTPSIADISAYQQADLILLNGAGYAKWTSKASLPRSKTVDTSRSFKERYISVKEVMTHSHGAEGDHSHTGFAFTTWLDLSLAVRQAEAVYIALSRKNPDLKPDFETNFKSLVADLQSLDGRIKEIVSRRHETLALFSHPVYEYFEQRYGVNAKSVHWEPDQKPTPEQQSELEKVLNSHPAKWMIWENNPIEEAEKGLDKMGIHSVVYNPCSNSPESGDFMSVMEQNIVNLAKAFQ